MPDGMPKMDLIDAMKAEVDRLNKNARLDMDAMLAVDAKLRTARGALELADRYFARDGHSYNDIRKVAGEVAGALRDMGDVPKGGDENCQPMRNTSTTITVNSNGGGSDSVPSQGREGADADGGDECEIGHRTSTAPGDSDALPRQYTNRWDCTLNRYEYNDWRVRVVGSQPNLCLSQIKEIWLCTEHAASLTWFLHELAHIKYPEHDAEWGNWYSILLNREPDASCPVCEGCGKPVASGDGHCLWEDGKRTCPTCQRKRLDADADNGHPQASDDYDHGYLDGARRGWAVQQEEIDRLRNASCPGCAAARGGLEHVRNFSADECEETGDARQMWKTMVHMMREIASYTLAAMDADRERRAEPRELARNQPCGCVICVCGYDDQCQGCGAKHCGTHPVGQIPNPVYVTPQPGEPDATEGQ